MPVLLAAGFLPFITGLSVVVLLVVLLCFGLKRLGQPYIIGYILAGVLLGESGLGLIERSENIEYLGEIGIVLLLFFVGMEIDLPKFRDQWRVALFGTALQIGLSVLFMFGFGWWLGWNVAQSIVLGFVVAMSSSAVIIRLLEERGIGQSYLGKNVLAVLLTQDIFIAPLIIITALLGGGASASPLEYVKLIGGAVLFVGIVAYIYRRRKIRLPFSKIIANDHELQVFVALLFCFGGTLLSAQLGLSAGLGAFVAGMVMHAGKATTWIHDTLISFRVIFVSIFFISVGLQIDFAFILEHWPALLVGLVAVYFTNHFVNAAVLRAFSETWREALFSGALLAQIGELSFLISSTAHDSGIFEDYIYQFTISLICITLVLSPFYILATEKLVGSRTESVEVGFSESNR